MNDDEVVQPDEQVVEEPKDTRAHILSPEELDAWKNGTDEGPVLRRAADVPAEEDNKTEAVVEEPVDEEVPDEPAVDPFAVTVTDPGDFAPNDYSFEVPIYDAEGKNPKTVKITSIDQWEEFLETDPNLGSGSAVLKAERQAIRMEASLEREREAYELK